MECGVCRKPITRFDALRVGGQLEEIVGIRFVCQGCGEVLKRVNGKNAAKLILEKIRGGEDD